MSTLTDNSAMPFGKHISKKMIEVPDVYLKWFWKDNKEKFLNDPSSLGYPQQLVMKYIQEHFNESEL